MPKFVTQDFKDKELYFDLRPGGKGKKEGFWATPIFDSERREKLQELQAEGKAEGLWIELLIDHIRKWVGFVDMNGADIPCTPENIRTLCESDFSAMMTIFQLITDAAATAQVVTEKN